MSTAPHRSRRFDFKPAKTTRQKRFRRVEHSLGNELGLLAMYGVNSPWVDVWISPTLLTPSWDAFRGVGK